MAGETETAKTQVRQCRWYSTQKKRESIQRFLREYGDDIPEADVIKATDDDNINNWITLCDGKGIAGAMRYEGQDWYLCALKNAATRPDVRRQGIGRKVYSRTARLALKDDQCLVLTADVTYDNIGSKKLLERNGFRTVNRFCWGEGEKPADVMHYVHVPPKGRRQCLGPKKPTGGE
jgi:ribosomal protein S18 acetylase RimI-like enzyme